jgi:hypothetical protein
MKNTQPTECNCFCHSRQYLSPGTQPYEGQQEECLHCQEQEWEKEITVEVNKLVKNHVSGGLTDDGAILDIVRLIHSIRQSDLERYIKRLEEMKITGNDFIGTEKTATIRNEALDQAIAAIREDK